MPIDFSLLKGQEPPRQGAIATIPQSNALDSLASGLMSGAKTAAELRNSNSEVALRNQQMQQSAQLFPSELKQSEDKATESDLMLQQEQGAAKSAKEVSDAFHKDWNTGMAKMAQVNPDGYLKLQGQITNQKMANEKLAGQIANNKKQEADAYNSINSQGYSLAQAAANAEKQQPGMGQKVYQQGLKMMGPSLAATLPQQFDETTYHTLTYLGAQSKLDQMKADEAKNGTPEIKNASKIGELQAKAQNKTISASEQGELDSLQAQINAKTNKSKDGTDADTIYQKALSTGLGQADAKAVTTASTTRGTMQHLLADTTDATELLKKIPAGYTGPIVDYFKANKMNSEVQEAQKLTAEIPFLTKSLVGITNGMRFTQGELEQLNRASGSTALNKDALQWVMDRTSTKSVEGIHANWQVENDIRKRGGGDSYDNWLKANPEPPKEINKDNSYQKAPVAFTTGKTYTDSKGNKAVYTGDPKNPWQEVK